MIEPGYRVDRFELPRRLGRGRVESVYLAHATVFGRLVVTHRRQDNLLPAPAVAAVEEGRRRDSRSCRIRESSTPGASGSFKRARLSSEARRVREQPAEREQCY
jgi:hypothetical protein